MLLRWLRTNEDVPPEFTGGLEEFINARVRTTRVPQVPFPVQVLFSKADELIGTALEGIDRESYCLVGTLGHDFYEGIRALIIDKDKSPSWRHESARDVRLAEVTAMLMPLGKNTLSLEDPVKT